MLEQVKTAAGVYIEYKQHKLVYENAIEPLLDRLDSHRGALFASSFEFPGRYTCWDIGFYNPPLAIICAANEIRIEALNKRGEVLIEIILPWLKNSNDLDIKGHSSSDLKIRGKKNRSSF